MFEDRVEVLSTGTHQALERLAQHVIHTHKYLHRYPYDWRTKAPVLIRATTQWFIRISEIREKALALLDGVNFVPENGRKRLVQAIESRPDWCISRQRPWGVPIPALYDVDSLEALTSASLIAHITSHHCQRTRWNGDPNDFLPPDMRPRAVMTGRDTFDVWFDSGVSWQVLSQR